MDGGELKLYVLQSALCHKIKTTTNHYIDEILANEKGVKK